MKIWLIGMMGSGKSSAGTLAASRLGVEFLDTDGIVAARKGAPIEEIWAEEGENAFRDIEKAVVGEIAPTPGVVATGGGVVLDAGNRATMRGSGLVVWLEASPPVLLKRIGINTGRPILDASDDSLTTLTSTLSEREPLYSETAHHRIVTDDLDLIATSARIEALWKS